MEYDVHISTGYSTYGNLPFAPQLISLNKENTITLGQIEYIVQGPWFWLYIEGNEIVSCN